MAKISEKVIALLLLLFLLTYVFYQIYRYYYNPLQTETAFEYSVSHSIEAKGLAVRNEIVIEQTVAATDRSVFENGVRISTGQVVIERYESGVSDLQIQTTRQLEQEISSLVEAQNPAVSNYSNVETINRDIRENLGYLSQMSSSGRFSSMETVGPNLVSLLNKKQVAIGKEINYQDRISKLQAEYNQLAGSSSTAMMDVASAPRSGYYVRQTDGLESLTPEQMKALSLEELCDIIESSSPQPSTNLAGKIVTTSTWYYAAVVPRDEVQWVNAGKALTLEFDSVDGEVPGIIEKVLLEQGEEDAVLLIRINHVNGDLLNLRTEQAVIHIQQYSGLRISSSSIHVRKTRDGNEVQGVFVLSKSTVKFKQIEPIYEEGSFVISRDTPAVIVSTTGEDEDNLVIVDSDLLENEELDLTLPESYEMIALYDQIIIKGRDLYHGKVIE